MAAFGRGVEQTLDRLDHGRVDAVVVERADDERQVFAPAVRRYSFPETSPGVPGVERLRE